MTFEEFELNELFRRHGLGEKLSYSEYCLLARHHYLNGDYAFHDFEEMEILYKERYPNLDDRIAAFRWQEEDFNKRTKGLDNTDPIIETMVDDWNFGEKCRATACQLEQEVKLIKSKEEQRVLKFSSALTDEELRKVYTILSSEKGVLKCNEEAWLYWFDRVDKPECYTLKWLSRMQYLADTIHMLTEEKTAWKQVIKKAFDLPNFKTNTRKSTDKGLVYQNIDAQQLYDKLKKESLL